MKRFLFFFFILPTLSFSTIPPETTPLIDSLTVEVSKSTTEEVKVDIYNKIAFQFLFIDTLKSIEYIEMARTLSEEIDYSQGLARALNIHAIHHSFQGRHEESITMNKSALAICQEDDHFVKGKIYNGLGLSYQRKYIVDKCLEYYQKALYHSTQVKDTVTMSIVLGNIAGINSTQQNDKEAKKYFLQLEKVASNYKDHNVQFAFHLRFAEFLTKNEEYEESNKYLEKALINAETLKHKNKMRMARLQLIINNINSYQYELAEIHLQEFISPEVEPNERTYMRYHYWKADLELQRKNYSKAIYNANIGLNKIRQQNNFDFYLPRILKILHIAESKVNNHAQAYDYLLELKSWQDSLDLKERENKFIELESKYQSEKKEIENVLLKEQSKLKTEQLKNTRMMSIAALVSLFLALLLLYVLWKSNEKEKQHNSMLEQRISEKTAALKKTYQELELRNNDLQQFAYITSHDLKEPITNIISYTGLIENKLKEINAGDQKFPPLFQVVKNSTDTLDKVVNALSAYTNINISEVNFEVIKLESFLSMVEDRVGDLIKEHEGQLYFDINPEIKQISFSPELLMLMLYNLIENGFKHNESKPAIVKLSVYNKNDKTIFQVNDNGAVIDLKYQELIFLPFKSLKNKSLTRSSGLGLAICRSIMRKVDNEIWLESSKEKGNSFCFSIDHTNLHK